MFIGGVTISEAELDITNFNFTSSSLLSLFVSFKALELKASVEAVNRRRDDFGNIDQKERKADT